MDEIKAVVYDGTSVTSPKNWNNPRFGDPCYSLHTDSRNYVVIALECHRHAVCFDIKAFDARGNGGGGIIPTMTGDHENRITDYTTIVCYSINGYAEYIEDLPTIRASGGDTGGGGEGLVVARIGQSQQTIPNPQKMTRRR